MLQILSLFVGRVHKPINAEHKAVTSSETKSGSAGPHKETKRAQQGAEQAIDSLKTTDKYNAEEKRKKMEEEKAAITAAAEAAAKAL